MPTPKQPTTPPMPKLKGGNQMTINERIAELEAKQEAIAKEIAELKEEAKKESIKISYQTGDDFCYFSEYGQVHPDAVAFHSIFKEYWKFHNVFPYQYADKVQDFCDHVIKINNLLMQYKLALCPDYEPDWGDDYVYYVEYNYIAECWGIRGLRSGDFHCVCFDKGSAQKVAKDLNRRGVKP